MKLLQHALALMFACAVTLGSVAFADKMVLTDDDYALLVGRWEGTYESRNTAGKVVYTLDVRLTVVEDGLGKFWISRNDREWGTIVDITDGKVVLRFGRAERPFTYEKEDDSATLSVRYSTEFEGNPRKDSLTMVKQSNE